MRAACLDCSKEATHRGRCSNHYRQHRHRTDARFREQRSAASRERYRAGAIPNISLPTQPLRDHVESLLSVARLNVDEKHYDNITSYGVAAFMGIQRGQWRRVMNSETLTIKMADRIACQLGIHPWHIWGDDFYAGTELAA